MTDPQWQELLAVVGGQPRDAAPTVGFIIDSPWLPAWCGYSILDYYTSDEVWLRCNLTAMDRFPQVLFLPGFWPEFGMCTEPSAFGGRSVWSRTELPHHERILRDDLADLSDLARPDVATDGLLPLALNRAVRCQPAVREQGHAYRFATSRGPLNIASFLMGTTELLMATQLCPERVHDLLERLAGFIVDWLALQIDTFDTIGGVFLLDDLIGFLGDDDFRTFAMPYLKRIYDAFDVPVRFLHNDAPGLVTAAHLESIGVNLFNFSHDHSMEEIRKLCGPSVALLGNLPPRDVLASGTAAEITAATAALTEKGKKLAPVILSCGGGMPPGVSTEQIAAFLEGAGVAPA